MPNILITGATGFIGSAVCKTLRTNKNDHHYSLIGTTRSSSQSVGPGRIPLCHIGDIGPDTNWSLPISKADFVIHLAARVHLMKDGTRSPLQEYRKVNTEGTINLAKQAATAGVKRFIFISTAKVGGATSPIKGLDETSPAKPQDAYSVSKWEAELALFKIAKTSKMEVVILRPPLVYGPGAKGNFETLIRAILNNRPLPLDAIDNRRSLLYVYNLANAIALSLRHPNAANQVFFLSDNETISTPNLIRKIAKGLGKNPRLFYLPIPLLRLAGKITRKSSSIERLVESLTINNSYVSNQLGWHPPFTTDEGLSRTAAWFDSSL